MLRRILPSSSSSSLIGAASSSSSLLFLATSRRECSSSATATKEQQEESKPAAADNNNNNKTHQKKKLQVFTTFDTADGRPEGLMHAMSEVEKEDYINRDALKLNSGQGMPDAIWSHHHQNAMMTERKGNYENYMNKDTQKAYMRVVDAAKCLHISKEEIPNLSKERIEEKFSVVYATANDGHTRDTLTTAAEMLLEYIRSPMAADLNRARKYQALHNMRKELDEETKTWHTQLFEGAIYGATGYVASVSTIFAVAIIGYYFYAKADHLYDRDNATVESMSKAMRNVLSYDPNNERAPDYQDRFKNTPTAWDMRKAEGHEEITDPAMRKALQDQDAVNKHELTLLHSMLLDAPEIEKRAQTVQHREEAIAAANGGASGEGGELEKRSVMDGDYDVTSGPRFLKEMMESRVDAQWWERMKKFQAMYHEAKFVNKW